MHAFGFTHGLYNITMSDSFVDGDVYNSMLVVSDIVHEILR